jgi:2-succinyl-5-enolpyruvyl-6-hydroxy-3-cyclohexene-1-carboxylate synthase
MSLCYDLNGLASQYNSKRFKIIVLCNGGGGIFRFINGPSTLPNFEQYFEVHRDIPIEKYANAFGFNYIACDNEVILQESITKLLSNNNPTILAIHTNNQISADTLRKYFNKNNNTK